MALHHEELPGERGLPGSLSEALFGDQEGGYAGGFAGKLNLLYGKLKTLAEGDDKAIANQARVLASRLSAPSRGKGEMNIRAVLDQAATEPFFADLVSVLTGGVVKVIPPEPSQRMKAAKAAAGVTRRTLLTSGVAAGASFGLEQVGLMERGTTVDLGSASAVFAGFLNHVGVRGVMNDIPLGPESAIDMALLAGGRIVALETLGGEAGRERADHDMEEIAHGLMPLPLLVALSDATTAEGHFGVDTKAIFATVEGALVKDFDYATVSRPPLHENVESWEGRLKKINKDLIDKVAQVAAVTTVLGPLGTTYTASSLANRLKEDVLRIVYEQSYALKVIEAHKAHEKLGVEGMSIAGVEELKHAKMHAAAKERAEALFNSPTGYSKLMTTLAANVQGVLGLGDPPEIYFAIDQLAAGDPAGIAISHLVGLGISEASTFLLNAGWLASAGVAKGVPDFGKAFLSGQMMTLASLRKTMVDSGLRDASLSSGRKRSERLANALRSKGDADSETLAEVVGSMPSARLQFDPAEYIGEKMRILTGMEGQMAAALSEPTVTQLLDHPEMDGAWADFSNGRWMKELLEDFRGGKIGKARKKVKALMELAQSRQASHFATLIEGLMKQEELKQQAGSRAASADAEKSEEVINAESAEVAEPAFEEAEHLDNVLNLTEQLAREFGTLSQGTQKCRIDDAMRELGAEDADMDVVKLRALIFGTDEKTAERVLRKLTKLGDKEDAVPGLGEGQSKARLKHHAHLLSHSSKEVLWALLTQIPSVPSIARLVEEITPVLAFVEPGTPPGPDQLKFISGVVLTLTAIMSSSADNVAAYLFAASVLTHFFKETFGEHRVEHDKKLKRTIRIIAKLVAEFAGSLSKLGNGPNFTQEVLRVVESDNNAQGIGVDRVDEKLSDTYFTKNMYSMAANLAILGGGIMVLAKEIDGLVGGEEVTASSEMNSPEAPASPQDIPGAKARTRRGFFNLFLGGASEGPSATA